MKLISTLLIFIIYLNDKAAQSIAWFPGLDV